MTITDDEIKSARALCDAATPGPWKHVRGPAARDVLYDANGRELLFTSNEYYARADLEENDAAFIAAARTLVPRLLDEVEQARRELSEAHDIANDQIRQRTNLAAFVEGEAWRMAALRAVLADAMALLDTVNPDYSRDEWERLANRIAALKSKVAP